MAGPHPISIWRPGRVDGEPAWVRPEPGPLGDHHAAERVLRPRRGPLPRRVCWFGESAAAGYLYAPHATPARVLEGQLRELAGPDGYEVIDLARTNETLAGLVATVEAALQLDPDLLVLFAGNNWTLLETPEVSPYAPSAAGRRAFAAALAQAGPAGAVGLARRTLDGRVREALDRVAELAGRAGTGVVLVLPEVNLADWESRQPPVWLPGDGTARWYAHLDDALAALDRGDPAAAEEAAWRMNALDGSTGPVPFRLLARAWAAQGRETEARDAALAEVDSVHYPLLCFLGAPQATSAARALLAGAAERHGWAAVDLRQVFAAWTGSALPGRRLFLDYCHLTAEGIHVAMAAVAAEVLGRAPAPGAPREAGGLELARRLPPPRIAPGAEATARLGAALHGAHRLLPVGGPFRRAGPLPGREPSVLEHWCTAALEASPEAARAMVDLTRARLAPAPAVLTAPGRRLLESPYPLGLQHGLRWDGLDGEVLEAMAAALGRAGRPQAAEIEAALAAAGTRSDGRAGAGLGPGLGPGLDLGLDLGRGLDRGLDLGLDRSWDLAGGARFLAEPTARFYPEAMDLRDLPGRALLRCPWPETGFRLPAAGPGPLTLRLIARLPPVPGVPGCRRGRATVEVNGREAGEVPLGERWTRATVRLPAGLLRSDSGRGLDRIAIRWPMPPPVGEQALRAARRRLADGVEADLHPVFGEVFSLHVGPG